MCISPPVQVLSTHELLGHGLARMIPDSKTCGNRGYCIKSNFIQSGANVSKTSPAIEKVRVLNYET